MASSSTRWKAKSDFRTNKVANWDLGDGEREYFWSVSWVLVSDGGERKGLGLLGFVGVV